MCVEGEFVKRVRVPKNQPIIGYRAWTWGHVYEETEFDWLRHTINSNILKSGLVPVSSNWGKRQETWFGKIAKADVCPSIDPNYQYGLHACSSWQALRQAGWASKCYRGSVKLWGWVNVYEKGYLAQFGQIEKVIVSKHLLFDFADVKRLRALYPWAKVERAR